MLDVELHGFDKLVEDLEKVAKKAIPYAQRDAVNSAAFATRRIWSEEIKKTFVQRNQFTAGRALQVDRARDLRRIEATLGSIAKYMPVQEEGGTVRGRHAFQPIAGPVAAGQPAGSHRTKLVRAGFKLAAITAAKAKRGGSRMQRNAAAMAIAKRAGRKFALLERPSGGRGLFLLTGGKRKLKARLLWDLSRRSVRIKPAPTLGPSLGRIQPRLPELYREALVKQLQRWHVYGY